MSSKSKKRQTIAKRAREAKLHERRAKKDQKRRDRKSAAAEAADLSPEGPAEGVEDDDALATEPPARDDNADVAPGENETSGNARQIAMTVRGSPPLVAGP
jgi:hypothetical protein